MWISVSVGKFVMHAMITNPSQNWFLTRHRLQEEQPEFQERLRPVCSVGEKSMRSDRRAESNGDDKNGLDHVSRPKLRWIEECIDGKDVQVNEDDNVSPLQDDLVFWLGFDRLKILCFFCNRRTCFVEWYAEKVSFHFNVANIWVENLFKRNRLSCRDMIASGTKEEISATLNRKKLCLKIKTWRPWTHYTN